MHRVHGRAVSRRGVLGLTGGARHRPGRVEQPRRHRLPAYPGSYVVANMAAAAALLAAARWAGLTWAELGLARRRLPAGLGWGGACVATIAAAYVVAARRSRAAAAAHRCAGRRAGRRGDRVPGPRARPVRHRPVGGDRLPRRAAGRVACACALAAGRRRLCRARVFGIWHIRPTLNGLAANDFVDGAVPTAAAVLAACLGTAAAGVVFTLLRLRSGSLLAPVAAPPGDQLARHAGRRRRHRDCSDGQRQLAGGEQIRAAARPCRSSSPAVGGRGPRRRRTRSCRRARARPARRGRMARSAVTCQKVTNGIHLTASTTSSPRGSSSQSGRA